MSKFWRIALAWLLAMALPMQGYAAQTMLLCGPAHHQIPTAAVQVMTGHDHAGMAHAEAEMSQPADQASPAATKHAGKCSLCASCCNAVALMAQVVSVAVAPPDLPEIATVATAHDRVLVGGLDRPPRISRI